MNTEDTLESVVELVGASKDVLVLERSGLLNETEATSTNIEAFPSTSTISTSSNIRDMRRESVDLEHLQPRKRIAMDDDLISKNAVESDEENGVNYSDNDDDARDGDDRAGALNDDSDLDTNGYTVVDRISAIEADLNAQQDAYNSSMSELLTSARRAMDLDNPEEWIAMISEYLLRFLNAVDATASQEETALESRESMIRSINQIEDRLLPKEDLQDEVDKLFVTGETIFTALPDIAIDLIARPEQVPNFEIVFSFLRLIVRVAVFVLRKARQIIHNESSTNNIDLTLPVRYLQALRKIFRTQPDDITPHLSNVSLLEFYSIANDFYQEKGIDSLGDLITQIIKRVASTNDGGTSTSLDETDHLLPTAIIVVDTVSALSLTLWQHPGTSDSDSDQEASLDLFPARELSAFFQLVETSIKQTLDMTSSSPGQPALPVDRRLLESLIDKSTILFHVLIQCPQSPVITLHPATHAILKHVGHENGLSLDDVRQVGDIARKFYWSILFFKYPRADLKLYGIQTLTTDLNAFYDDGSFSNSPALVSSISAVIHSLEFTEYLLGSDSHAIYLSQFASNIYSLLAVFHVIDFRDINIFWKVAFSTPSTALSTPSTNLLISLCTWADSSILESLLRRASDFPLSSVDSLFLKLLEAIVNGIFSFYQKQDPDRSGGNSTFDTDDETSRLLKSPPLQVYSDILDILFKVDQYEATKLILSPELIISSLDSCLTTLFKIGPSLKAMLELINSAIETLVHRKDGSESFKSLLLVKCVFSAADFDVQASASGTSSIISLDSLQQDIICILDRYSFYENFVSIVNNWTLLRSNSSPSLNDIEIGALQDILYYILRLKPSALESEENFGILLNALSSSLSNDSGSCHLRDRLFSKLASLSCLIASPCPFMDYCFRVITELPTSILTFSCINFAVRYIKYLRVSPIFIYSADPVIPGFSTLWNIYINIPENNHTAKQKCLAFLVWLFTDSEAVAANPDITIKAIEYAIKFGKNVSNELLTSDATNASISLHRTLKFLDELMEGYKNILPTLQPSGSSSIDSKLSNSVDDYMPAVRGTAIDIRLQWHACEPVDKSVKNITLGEENRVSELNQFIASLLGIGRDDCYDSFQIFVMGSKLSADSANRTLKEAGFRDVTAVMIVRKSRSSSPASYNAIGAKIVSLLDSIFDLLDLPNEYASIVWRILSKIRPSPAILELFLKPDSLYEAWNSLFTLGKPFKFIYLDYAFSIAYEMHHNDLAWIEKCRNIIVKQLIKSLLEKQASSLSADDMAVMDLATDVLIQRIVQLVRCSPSDISLELSNTGNFISEVSSIASRERHCNIVGHTVDLILACSVVDHSILSALITGQDENWYDLLYLGLLGVSDTNVRFYIASSIKNLIKDISSRAPDRKDSVLQYFWRHIISILPTSSDSDELIYSSRACFELADFLLDAVLCSSNVTINEEEVISCWYSRIISRECARESLFDPEPDNIIDGYTLLLIRSIKSCRDHSKISDALQAISSTVLVNYLFPHRYIETMNDDGVEESIGCVHNETRQRLYQLLFLLVDSDADNAVQNVHRILTETENLDYDGWNGDRNHWIRAKSGYVGLQNLSNTCYVNSFVSQLYMNEDFRKIIFGLGNSSKENESSALVNSMVELFANLKYSWEKMLDTREFIGSIDDFENKPIDVSVQMDVDEFYSLLLDRLESQIKDDSLNTSIKNNFSGTLVTQIKSRECSHVSERIEAFSAIQCFIKGKSNLSESLDAYVEGEVMDGDNKYWCSQCAAHVEAEKRICFKNLPDHLIFHLKRFDFDLQTMLRSKINDYFEFPMEIDVSPYTFDVLCSEDANNSIKSNQNVKFELVGILVHSGTAESGHYYSYIKDKGNVSERWHEFNDDDVTEFDPNLIATSCYGGTTNDVGGYTLEKPFSAYMLFYDRLNPTADVSDSACKEPPSAIRNNIRLKNENLATKYSLFGEEHIRFIISLYEKCMSASTTTIDSKDTISTLMFETVYRVSSRVTNISFAERSLALIEKYTVDNGPNSRTFLKWLSESQMAARSLLVRCPHMAIRQGISRLIKLSLLVLSREQPDTYGTLTDWISEGGEKMVIPKFYSQLVNVIHHITMTGRVSEEFFTLLVDISELGSTECAFLIYSGTLQASLEAFFDSRRPTKRRQFCTGLMSFICMMLDRIDLMAKPIESIEERCKIMAADSSNISSIPLSTTEAELLLGRRSDSNRLEFAYQVLELECPPDITMALITKVARATSVGAVLNTVLSGLVTCNIDSSSSFLSCLERLFRMVPSNALGLREWEHIIAQVFCRIQIAAESSGRAYAGFIWRAINDRNISIYLRTAVLSKAPIWIPVLVGHWDRGVREIAERIWDTSVLSILSDEDAEPDEKEQVRMILQQTVRHATSLIECQLYDPSASLSLSRLLTSCVEDVASMDDAENRAVLATVERLCEILDSSPGRISQVAEQQVETAVPSPDWTSDSEGIDLTPPLPHLSSP
ncbi:hypothetical protein V1511DRAFT_486817 [Dipodascopsis uninucleata]